MSHQFFYIHSKVIVLQRAQQQHQQSFISNHHCRRLLWSSSSSSSSAVSYNTIYFNHYHQEHRQPPRGATYSYFNQNQKQNQHNQQQQQQQYTKNQRTLSISSISTSHKNTNTMSSTNNIKDNIVVQKEQDDNMEYIFPPPNQPFVKIHNTNQVFPVHRIYCVAKNYIDHIKEMGDDPIRETPCFFMKPSDAIIDCTSTNNTITKIPYPLMTNNLHYEIELVIAIGKGGKNILYETASQHIYGYTIGCDLTRRDLQSIAKANGRPWDSSKGFDHSAPIGTIIPIHNNSNDNSNNDSVSSSPFTKDDITEHIMNHNEKTNIWLSVNDHIKQNSTTQHMIWNIYEIIVSLSNEFILQSGDLIYTGTPAGVGPIVINDIITGGIDHIGNISFQIVKDNVER